jgi:ribosomal protein S18 acetylase RimI-like enzyme
MTEEDLPVVCSLYLDANAFAPIDSIKKWTADNLQNFPELQLVFCASDKLAGAISGNVANNVGHVDDIVIAKEFRGKGIGTQLLLKELGIFRKLRVPSVELWVHSANEKAIPFYLRNGFKVIGVEHTKDLKDVPDGEKITKLSRVFHEVQ